MTDLSRNAQLIKYFAQQCPGIPRKHLVKLAYMADLVARQYLGHPISDFEYVVYHYGPYPPAILSAIEELESQGLAWTQERRKASPDDLAFKRLFDSGKPTVFDFTLGQNEVLAFVVRNFLNMDTAELVEDIVYTTAPYRAALETGRFKERIPMEIEDGSGRAAIGFDLERILNAKRQAEEGDYVTAREYFDGLRNRIAARHAE